MTKIEQFVEDVLVALVNTKMNWSAVAKRFNLTEEEIYQVVRNV